MGTRGTKVGQRGWIAGTLVAAGLVMGMVFSAAAGAQRPERLHSPADVYQYVYEELALLDFEKAVVLYVDGDGQVLSQRDVSQGKPNRVHVVPWELTLRGRPPEGTSQIYLVHNHPGGSNWLSQADLKVGSFWHHVAKDRGYTLDLLAVTSRDYVSMLETNGLAEPVTGWRKQMAYVENVIIPGLVVLRSELAEILQ